MAVADYVLSRPRKQAEDEFRASVETAAQAVPFLIANGLEKTQQEFN